MEKIREEHTVPVFDRFAASAFSVAWCWLLVAAGLGVVLRWLPLNPLEGWNLSYLRHAHSHVAFLGWVFNAYFALAVWHFVPWEKRGAFTRLFVVLQVAVAGMAATFPLQGYAAGSIAFSTLHMVTSAVFAAWMWRSPRVVPPALSWLRLALVFMLLSGLGPLALGPLAANDLRDHPAYVLAIYFYLHCQYNGWFVFFLLAVVVQMLAAAGIVLQREGQVRALVGLSLGTGFGFALSTLWLDPGWPVWSLATGSGMLQLYGAWHLRFLLYSAWSRLGAADRLCLLVPVGSFILKLLLQMLATVPFLAPLAYHRFVAISFLHLIFLGIVTPAVWVWACRAGWIRPGILSLTAAALCLLGTLGSELILAAVPLTGMGGRLALELLLGSAALLFAGIALNATRLRLIRETEPLARRPPAKPNAT